MDDNRSIDGTAEHAATVGAIVRYECLWCPTTRIGKQTQDVSDLFVYNSPRAVKDLLGEEHNYGIEKVYQWEKQIEPVHITKGMLWKIAKR